MSGLFRGAGRRAAVLWLAGLLPLPALAGFIDQRQESVRLASEVSYRIDTGSETSFESVSTSGGGWTSQQVRPFQGTGEPVRLWARFELPASDASRRVFILTGAWESVEYVFVRDGKLVGRQLTGTLVPSSRRTTHVTMVPPLLSAGFAAVDVPANARTTVYARLAHENRFFAMEGLRFSLWDEARVHDEEVRDRLVQGVFIGAMLLLLAYNLALYLLDTRDPTYLYYAAGLACGTAIWIALSGLGFDLLWPEHPGWDWYVLSLALPVGIFSFAQFMRRYMDTVRHLPLLDRHFNWVAIGALVLPPMVQLVSARFPILQKADIAFVWIPATAAIAALWVSISSLIGRLPHARLFAIAVGCAVLGNLVSTLPFLGAPWPLLLHANQLGTVVMGTVLTIGMGIRMRDLRAELAGRQIREARIEGERRQAEAANKHKSEFLANMSHELRTPLNAIIGFSEVMLSGMAGSMPEKQKEFIGDIRDSGKHLLALINDILDLSKIEAGRMELDVARFDLQAAMANAVTLVRGRAERHGIKLDSQVAPDVGEYDGDERKFKQIVLNLLTNAVKFTPEGGSVTLGAERTDGTYVFSVSDSGVGIAPEDHEAIFEEFKQVGNDYDKKA